jgi:hypothetical protein
VRTGFDCKYFHIGGLQLASWLAIYSDMDVHKELEKMVLWLDANPKKRKKDYRKFCINWLNRTAQRILERQYLDRMYAQVGTKERPVVDYSAECEEIRKKYPDLQ